MDKLLQSKNYFSCQRQKDETIEQTVERLMKRNATMATKRLIDLGIFVPSRSEESKAEKRVEYHEFNVFGCDLSTDIDIICRVATREDLDGKIDLERLNTQLKTLGYSDDRLKKIDVNLVYVENGQLRECSRGGKIIQNIVYYTYALHRQAHPRIFSSPLLNPNDVSEHLQSIAKFFLDNMKTFLDKETYTAKRAQRRIVYGGGFERVSFVGETMYLVDYDRLWITPEGKSLIKSLVMKLIQLILFDEEVAQVYTKRELATSIATIKNGDAEVVALYLLTRGSMGREPVKKSTFILDLCDDFLRISKSCHNELKWFSHTTPLVPFAMGTLSKSQMANFLKSPLKESKDLDIENISANFEGKCTNLDKIPAHLRHKHIDLDPRSPEWLEYYHDRNSYRDGEVKGFNIVRGCIIESLVVQCIDYAEMLGYPVDKVTIGFLATSNKFCAPDLLLYDEKQVALPVEIKCIPEAFAPNKSYRRAVHMAKLQLKNALDILNEDVATTSKSGIITLVNISDKIEIHSALVHYNT